MKERWWTSPAEGEKGGDVIVTGRDYMEKPMESGKYNYRVEVSWDYTPTPNGMPDDEEAELMEQATDALQTALRNDKAAYMTAIVTGENRRDWVFYTKNLAIFGKILNGALRDLPQMPLAIEAYEDPEWENYRTMREATYIPEDDDEV